MSFSYNGRLADSNRDKVRFLIQDHTEESHLIEDEEIDGMLVIYGSNIKATCAALCETMAARWAKKQEFSSSNYRQNMDSVYSKLIKLANRFRINAVSTSHFRAPAISVADKEAQEDDTDNVDPSFKRNLFDNPFAESANDDKSDVD